MKKYNYVFIVVMVAVCGYVILTAASFPTRTLKEGYGPGLMPMLSAGIILFLCLILLIQTILTKPEKEEKITGLDWKTLRNPVLFIVSMILFMVLLKYIGLLLDTFVFMMLTTWIMKVKIQKALVVSLIASAVIYVGFGVLLKVPFPAGILLGA
jgi:putative tricarboxylic transport membrane protein